MQFGGQNRIRKTVHAIGVAALSLALVLSSTPAWAIEESESDAVLEVTDDFAGDTQEEVALLSESEPLSDDVRLDSEAEPEAMVYDEDVAVDEESLPDESASDTQEELFDEPKPEEAGEPLTTTEPLPGDQVELPEEEADAVLPEDEGEALQRVSGYDTYDTARSIAIGTQYSANLTNYSDVDWYKFTAPSAGYFTLTFGKTYASSGSWDVYLYDSDMDGSITSWRFEASNNRTDTTQRIGLPAGTYYLKVNTYYSAHTTTPYWLKVNFTQSGVWERETANGEWTGSLGMKLGTVYNGTMYDYSDVDWYKFTAPSAGYFTLTFGKTYASSGSWDVYLYDSDMDGSITSWRFEASNNRTDTTQRIGLPAGTYYLKVNTYYSAHTTTPYWLKVNFTQSGVWERETANGEWTGSLGMKLGTVYNGTMYDYSDVDWYKFTAPSAGYFTLTFGKTYASSGSWDVYLYDSDMDGSITSWRFEASNNRTDTTQRIGLPAGTYYLKVNTYYSAHTTTPYSIKVAKTKAKNTLTAKGKTKKASAKKLKKKALTLSKCIKVSKAQGAVTYKKVSGSKRLKVNAKTGKITVKKKTKKGTYTIKVKVTASGNASYKAASKTVKVKVKVK